MLLTNQSYKNGSLWLQAFIYDLFPWQYNNKFTSSYLIKLSMKMELQLLLFLVSTLQMMLITIAVLRFLQLKKIKPYN